jgi:hypothetical protein
MARTPKNIKKSHNLSRRGFFSVAGLGLAAAMFIKPSRGVLTSKSYVDSKVAGKLNTPTGTTSQFLNGVGTPTSLPAASTSAAGIIKIGTGATDAMAGNTAAELTTNRVTSVGTSTSATTYPTTGAVVTALNAKANLASPAFTGTPTCPTPTLPT